MGDSMGLFHRKKDRLLREFIELIPSLDKEDLEDLIGVLLAMSRYSEIRGGRKKGDPILVDRMDLPDSIVESMIGALGLIVKREKDEEEIVLWSWRPEA